MVNSTILLVHACVTWFLVGLIWLIQVVHYPLMKMVGREEFVPYSLRHQQAITPVVGISMLLEVATAAFLLIQDPNLRRSSWFLAACVLLVVIWASTAFWQVPLHRDLLNGHVTERVERLISSNWLRTIAWSVRGGIVGVLVLSRMRPS